MPTTKTIVGYLYRDEYYCPACIVEQIDPQSTQDARDQPERHLSAFAWMGCFDRTRPASFSQRDFPHTITSGQLDEPARCDTCRTEIR